MDISNFFEIIYSTPIAFYSIPFSVLFVLLFLATAGLITDTNIDLDAIEISGGLKLFFAHFHVSKAPVIVFLFLFFMYGTLSLVFVRETFNNELFTVLLAFANIYLCAKVAGLTIKPFLKYGSQKEEIISYIGLEGVVSSATVSENGGFINCDVNNDEHQLNAYTDNNLILNKGDRVLVLRKDEEKFLVVKYD